MRASHPAWAAFPLAAQPPPHGRAPVLAPTQLARGGQGSETHSQTPKPEPCWEAADRGAAAELAAKSAGLMGASTGRQGPSHASNLLIHVYLF